MHTLCHEPDCFVVICDNNPKVVGVTESLQDARDWAAGLSTHEPAEHYRAIRATRELAEYRHDWGWTTLWVREEGREVELAVVGKPLRLSENPELEWKHAMETLPRRRRRRCRPR